MIRSGSRAMQSCCKCMGKEAPKSVQEFSDITTLHGVPDLIRSGGCGRWFWILILAGAVAVVTYECYAVIAQYLSSPVVISYLIHPEPHGRELPDVVICPFSRFNQSFLNEHEIDQELTEYMQIAFSLLTPYPFAATANRLPSNYTFIAEKLEKLLKKMGGISYEDLIHLASHSCEALLPYCMFRNRGSNCCEFAESVLTVVGKCYRIHGPKQRGAGYSFGMTVVIEIPPPKVASSGLNNLHNNGISVKIAEKGKGVGFDLTFIPPGVHALMPLRATRFEFMNDPPRFECLEDVPSDYSATRCFDDCFFEHAKAICQCRHLTTEGDTYPACKPDELELCLINRTRERINVDTSHVEKCQNLCTSPCKYWQFYPTVSYAQFPAETLYNYVPRAEEHLWSKRIVLDIFYEKLEYTVIKHFSSMTLDTFVANIGGQVGLWIGGSILSVLQLVYFCFQALFKRTLAKKVKKQASHKRTGPLFHDKHDLQTNGSRLISMPLSVEHCRCHSCVLRKDSPLTAAPSSQSCHADLANGGLDHLLQSLNNEVATDL